MDKAAGQALGEEILGGALVMPAGYASKMVAASVGRSVAGVAGAMAGEAVAAKRKAPSTPGGHQKAMYMALTPQHLVFFAVKQGLLKKSLGSVLVSVRRGDIDHFDLEGKGLTNSALTVELADGTVYALAVPRVAKGAAEKVGSALAA